MKPIKIDTTLVETFDSVSKFINDSENQMRKACYMAEARCEDLMWAPDQRGRMRIFLGEKPLAEHPINARLRNAKLIYRLAENAAVNARKLLEDFRGPG